MSGLISTQGAQFRDWTADYRLVGHGRFDRQELFGAVIEEAQSTIDPAQPIDVCLDDTSVGKTGRKVWGAKWRPDRTGPKFQVNLVWAQRFLQISMAVPHRCQSNSAACMVPVEFLHCPGAGKPPSNATAQEVANHKQRAKQAALPTRAAAALAQLRTRLDPARTLVCSGDGGYTNAKLLKSLPPNTIFVGRIRKDAKLFARPLAQTPLGRRRIYGERLPTPEEIRTDDAIVWQTIQAHLGGQLRDIEVKAQTVRWKAAGDKDLKLIIVRPLKYKLSKNAPPIYREPLYLIATDTDFNTQHLVQNYLCRWGIEQNFRDEKQVIGIGESYVRTEQSVQAMPALLVAAYAILRLACRNSQAPNLDRPKWHRRANTNPLTANREIALLRNSLWQHALAATDHHFSGFASRKNTNAKPPKLQNTLAAAVLYASRC